MSFQVMFFSVNPFQFRVVTSCGTILHVDEHTTYIVIYTMITDQEMSRQDEHMTYMLFIPCILTRRSHVKTNIFISPKSVHTFLEFFLVKFVTLPYVFERRMLEVSKIKWLVWFLADFWFSIITQTSFWKSGPKLIIF